MNEPTSVRDILDRKTISNIKFISAEVNPSFLKELIGMYVSQAPGLIETIKTHAADGNSAELEAAAHRLKGSSLTLGALQVADVCGALEQKGRQQERDGLEPLVEKLEQGYAALLTELEKLEAQEAAEEVP